MEQPRHDDQVGRRLETFEKWPLDSPVKKEHLARYGFVAVETVPEDDGTPFLSTVCDSCGLEVRDWGDHSNQAVFDVHRRESPHCQFVVTLSSLLKTSPDARLETFYDWPPEVNFVSPRRLADCGLYYLHSADRVRCAFCLGVLYNWVIGDDPLVAHCRNFPACPFILDPAKSGHLAPDVCGRCSPRPQRPHISGHVPHQPPRFTTMALTAARVKTFTKYTGPEVNPVDPMKLAEAGFYCPTIPTYIRCFHCGLMLSHWQPDDDPWVEHARWNPLCSFVILNKGAEFVRECMRMQEAKCQSIVESALVDLETVEPVPFEMNELRKLKQSPRISMFLDTWKLPDETVDLLLLGYIRRRRTMEGVDDDEHWKHIYAEFSRALNISGHPPPLQPAVSEPSENVSPPEEQQLSAPQEPPTSPPACAAGPSVSTEEEKKKKSTALPAVEEQKGPGEIPPLGESNDLSTMCKLCYMNELCIVFMPCGHLISCAQCSPACVQCPTCRSKIESAIRIFLQ